MHVHAYVYVFFLCSLITCVASYDHYHNQDTELSITTGFPHASAL